MLSCNAVLKSYFQNQIYILHIFAGVPLDGDDPEHIQWIYERSLERAAQFNIKGLTYRLTQGKKLTCHLLVILEKIG